MVPNAKEEDDEYIVNPCPTSPPIMSRQKDQWRQMMAAMVFGRIDNTTMRRGKASQRGHRHGFFLNSDNDTRVDAKKQETTQQVTYQGEMRVIIQKIGRLEVVLIIDCQHDSERAVLQKQGNNICNRKIVRNVKDNTHTGMHG